MRWNIWFGVILTAWPLTVRGESGAAPGTAPLDMVPFGYVYHAGAARGANPPEVRWLTNDGAGVLAGVLWEEHRPVRRIEVQFAGEAPEASQLRLEVTTSTPTEKQNNRPTWWTRKYEEFPGVGKRIAEGHGMAYETDRAIVVERLNQYHEGFRYEADPQGLIFIDKLRLRYEGTGQPPAVVSLRAFGATEVVPLGIEVEWGLTSEERGRDHSGSLQVYNGSAASLQPLTPNGGVVITGPPFTFEKSNIDQYHF